MPEPPSTPTNGEPDAGASVVPPRRAELASETAQPSEGRSNLQKFLLSVVAGFAAAVVYWTWQPAPRDGGLADLGLGIAILFHAAVAFVVTTIASRVVIAVVTQEPVEHVVLWLLAGLGALAGLYSLL